MRTLTDFASMDAIPSMALIGRIYVPGFSGYGFEDFREFKRAFEWAVTQTENFGVLMAQDRSRLKVFPDFVKIHLCKIGGLLLVANDLIDDRESKSGVGNVPVTYPATSSFLEIDIRRTLWTIYNNMRIHQLDLHAMQYGKPHRIDPNILSKGLILDRVNRLFLSCGEDFRTEASDMLIGELFLYFWFDLQKRARQVFRQDSLRLGQE